MSHIFHVFLPAVKGWLFQLSHLKPSYNAQCIQFDFAGIWMYTTTHILPSLRELRNVMLPSNSNIVKFTKWMTSKSINQNSNFLVFVLMTYLCSFLAYPWTYYSNTCNNPPSDLLEEALSLPTAIGCGEVEQYAEIPNSGGDGQLGAYLFTALRL